MINLLLVVLVTVLAVLDFASLKTYALGTVCIVFGCVLLILPCKGFVCINPNQAVILVLCGKYVGTVKQNGCFWINPLYRIIRFSLRAQNYETPIIKVNDKLGNPVKVAAICVWRVQDTYKSAFDVENCGKFVSMQVESALRKLIDTFAYDNLESEPEENTLR